MMRLRENKKGQVIPAFVFIVGLVIVGILIAAFLFSPQIRWLLIGVGIIIFAFVFIVKKEVTKANVITFFIIIAVGVAVILVNQVVTQSIFSASNVHVGTDGKVYWVVTASVNNPDEQYVFSQLFNPYTKPDGTVVTPQDGLTIVTSPADSECVYQTNKDYFTAPLGMKAYFYALSNPQRVVKIDVTDSYGSTKTLDGTVISSVTFGNNNGYATVQTQGILGGKYDCPNYDNVIILKDTDYGINDNGYYFVYRNDFSTFVSTRTVINAIKDLLFGTGGIVNVKNNAQFTNSFTSIPVFDGTNVTGKISLGSAVLTITADQEYFNSLVYIPPKDPAPVVNSINIPSKITQSTSSSMIVIVKNNNANAGTISISASSSVLNVAPAQINAQLPASGQVSQTFTLSAPSTLSCGPVSVTACSTGQFATTQNCNTKSANVCIIASEAPTKCGDGICQSNENFNTCPQDCTNIVQPNITTECKWYQEPYQSQEKTCKLLGLFWCETQPVSGCKTAGWVYAAIGGGVVVILGVILILSVGKKSKIKRRRR